MFIARPDLRLSNIPIGAGANFYYTCTTAEGALLLLPDGASKEDLRDTGTFLDQALKHGITWYEYANIIRRRRAENGSLYLVTGCDKATSWGIASCSNGTGGTGVSLKFTAAQVAAGSGSYSYKWETSSPATVRFGPISRSRETLQVSDDPGRRIGRNPRRRNRNMERAEIGQQSIQSRPGISKHPLYQNQCVLVRGYRISIRSAFAKLKGQLDVSPIEDTESSDLFSKRSRSSAPFTDGKKQPWTQSWFGKSRNSQGSGGRNQQKSKLPGSLNLGDKGEVLLKYDPEIPKVVFPRVTST